MTKRWSCLLMLFLLMLFASGSLAAGLVPINEGERGISSGSLALDVPANHSEFALCDGAQLMSVWYSWGESAGSSSVRITEKGSGKSIIEKEFPPSESEENTWILPDGLLSEGTYIFSVTVNGETAESEFTVWGSDQIGRALGAIYNGLGISIHESITRIFNTNEEYKSVYFETKPENYSVISYYLFENDDLYSNRTINAGYEHVGYSTRMSDLSEQNLYSFILVQNGNAVGRWFSVKDETIVNQLSMSNEEILEKLSSVGVTLSDAFVASSDESETDLSNYGLYLLNWGGHSPHNEANLIDFYQPDNGSVFALVEGGNFFSAWSWNRYVPNEPTHPIYIEITDEETGEVLYTVLTSTDMKGFWMPKGIYKPNHQYQMTLSCNNQTSSVRFSTIGLQESKNSLPIFSPYLTISEPTVSDNGKTLNIPIESSGLEKIKVYTFYMNNPGDELAHYLSERDENPSTTGVHLGLNSESQHAYINMYVVVQGEQAAGITVGINGSNYAFGEVKTGTLCVKNNLAWIETDPVKVESYRSDPKTEIISTFDKEDTRAKVSINPPVLPSTSTSNETSTSSASPISTPSSAPSGETSKSSIVPTSTPSSDPSGGAARVSIAPASTPSSTPSGGAAKVSIGPASTPSSDSSGETAKASIGPASTPSSDSSGETARTSIGPVSTPSSDSLSGTARASIGPVSTPSSDPMSGSARVSIGPVSTPSSDSESGHARASVELVSNQSTGRAKVSIGPVSVQTAGNDAARISTLSSIISTIQDLSLHANSTILHNEHKGSSEAYPDAEASEFIDINDSSDNRRSAFIFILSSSWKYEDGLQSLMSAYNCLPQDVAIQNHPEITSRYRTSLPGEFSDYFAADDYISVNTAYSQMVPVFLRTDDGLYYHELYLLFHYGDDTQQNGKNIQAIAVITNQEDVRRHITDMLQNDMLHNRGFYEAWLANTNDTFRYASPYGLDMYATAIRAQQPSTGNVSIDRSRATLAFTVQIQQGSNAYVRQRPDASSAYVGLAKAGSLYPLISTSDNGWYEIQLENGTTGFVSSKKATKVGR